jgi:hypothetical protein
VNTPVWGGLGMFWVGDIDGEVDDGPVVVVAVPLDVVVVVVEVDGLLLPLLPHAAVNAPAAMIATPPAAAAMRPAFAPDLISVFPIIRRLLLVGTISCGGGVRRQIKRKIRDVVDHRLTEPRGHSPLGGDMTTGPRVMLSEGPDVALLS